MNETARRLVAQGKGTIAAVPLVEIHRGPVLEALHQGILCVSDPAGTVLYSAGKIEAQAILRSSAKPVQALASVLAGTVERFAVSDEELATACASHSGERRHVEAARSILRKATLGPDQLRCGIHTPFAGVEAGPDWGVLNNNCSGKHALMLATCVHKGWPLESYQEANHPLQQEIRRLLALLSGEAEETLAWGIDGCGVPAWGLPMRAAARAFAALADPRELPDPLAEACRRVVQSMTAHPGLVAGEGRICTELMEAGDGAFWAKTGAEGYYAVGLRPGQNSAGTGIAIKILDGDPSHRARAAVVLELLRRYGALGSERADALRQKHAPSELTNHRGQVAGILRTVLP